MLVLFIPPQQLLQVAELLSCRKAGTYAADLAFDPLKCHCCRLLAVEGPDKDAPILFPKYACLPYSCAHMVCHAWVLGAGV